MKMNKEILNKILDKHKNQRLKLYLSSGKLYTGEVMEITEEYVEILDKFNSNVTIELESIKQVEVAGDGQNGNNKL